MQLPSATDIAVVGCGIFGLSSAAWAAMAGRKVVAFDRARIGAGCSGRSGATIGAFYYNEMMARSVVETRRRIWESFDDVFRLSGSRRPVFERSGMIVVEDDAREGRAKFARWGVDIRELPADTVEGEFPWLRVPQGNETVWWDEEAGHVQTALALFRLKECVENHGGVVSERCPVQRITREPGNSWRIGTPKGEVSAGQVLLAPGPWAAELGRLVDLDLPVEVQRVQVTLVNRQANMPQAHPIISDRVNDFYARSYEGGISHVGTVSRSERTALADMAGFDENIRTDLAVQARENFERGVPGAGGTLFFGHRAAVYEVTPDEYFILGETPYENLFVSVGGSGHGYKLGPFIGQEISALMMGETAPFATSPVFALERDYGNKRGVFGE